MSEQISSKRLRAAVSNTSIGFGLERLGLLALRHPIVTAIAVLVFSVLTFSQLPRANVDAELLRVYENSGGEYDSYRRLTDTFGTFESDVYVLVRSENLSDPAVLEQLRELAFDLELNDFANGTLSPFTLRKPDGNGGTAPAVPEGMTTREEVQATLADLQANDPMMRNLIQPDLKGIVTIMFPNPEMTRVEGGIKAMVDSLVALDEQYSSADIDVQLAGQPIWTADLLVTTVDDQVRFSVFGFCVGAIIAFIALRSIWGALIVAATPVLALGWLMGAIIFLFGSFSFLTIIVTTLVLVVAFSGSMFLVFNWINYLRDGMDADTAVETLVRRVGPASALTSITTAVAFASLGLAPGRGVQEFAQAGALAMGLLFVALMTFLPLLLKVALRLGFKAPARNSLAVTVPIPVAWGLVRRFPRALAAGSIGLGVLLLVPYFLIQPQFSFQDFVPEGSPAIQAAANIDQGVGGVAPLYVRVPLVDGLPDISDRDFALIEQVHRTLERHLGEFKAISAASFSHHAESGFSREDIFSAVGDFLLRRFITEDASQALVTGFMPTMLESDDLKRLVTDVRADLATQRINADVGGLNTLTSFGTDDIVRNLQVALPASVLANLFIIGIAFRSWKIALVSALPNVFPILGTEAWLYLSGSGLQLTTVLALTIAFGIAVDDTMHMLAHYRQSRDDGMAHDEAVEHTMFRIGGAIIATTLILCSGVAIVAFSELPQVAVFGSLFVSTLALALLGDLFILPALLIAGGRFFKNLGGTRT